MQYNLADLWERVVDTVPERESLICGDRRLTYAEADERANRLAHHLAEQGVGPGDHVALRELRFIGRNETDGVLPHEEDREENQADDDPVETILAGERGDARIVPEPVALLVEDDL